MNVQERRGMLHIQVPADVLDELIDASLRRKTKVASEALLWLRVMAQQYKETREAAGEELIVLQETIVVVKPEETAWRRPWEN